MTVDVTLSEHHVDTFWEVGTPGYGWQCFTCGQEDKGFPIVAEAEAAGFRHSWKQLLTGQEP